MAQNITEEEKILLGCAKWGDMIVVDNSEAARISSTWICIINGILAIHGALLNALIVTVYYKDRRLQTLSNVLIVALAMADLSVCLIGQPVAIVTHGLKLYQTHSCILELSSFLLTESGIGLSCTIVCLVIPLERSLAIFFPLKHRALVTKHLLKAAIVVSSLIYAFSGVVFTFFVSLQVFFSAQLLAIIFGIVFVAAVYSRIFILVQKRTKTGRLPQGITPDNSPSPPRCSMGQTPQNCPSIPNCSSNVCKKIAVVDIHAQHTSNACFQTAEKAAEKAAQRSKKEKQVLKTMVMIFGALVLCFIPRVISIMCMIFGVTDVQMFYTYLLPWTDVMTYSNSSLNPYIYFFKNKDIFEATKRIVFGRTPRDVHRIERPMLEQGK